MTRRRFNRHQSRRADAVLEFTPKCACGAAIGLRQRRCNRCEYGSVRPPLVGEKPEEQRS